MVCAEIIFLSVLNFWLDLFFYYFWSYFIIILYVLYVFGDDIYLLCFIVMTYTTLSRIVSQCVFWGRFFCC